MKRAIAVLTLVTALAASPALAQGPRDAERIPDSIRVDVIGEATAHPDLATLTFAVTTDGEAVAAAREAAEKKLAAVMAALKEKQIPEKDVAEIYFNVTPIRARASGAPGPATGPVLGYQVIRGFSVTVPVPGPGAVTRVMEIAAAAVAAGADPPRWRDGDLRLPGHAYGDTSAAGDLIRFTSTQMEKLSQDAIRTAITNARATAQALATAGGQTIGDLCEANVRYDTAMLGERPATGSSSVWQPIRVRVPLTAVFALGRK